MTETTNERSVLVRWLAACYQHSSILVTGVRRLMATVMLSAISLPSVSERVFGGTDCMASAGDIPICCIRHVPLLHVGMGPLCNTSASQH